MERRELEFGDFDEVLAEVQRLRSAGYTRAGQWNLAQICDHLAYFIEGSLDGYGFRAPWLLKVIFGGFIRRRILNTRRMKAGVPTPQTPLPPPETDEAEAVKRLETAIARFRQRRAEFRPSPFFGALSPEQWRTMHLVHCAHHLGFLLPK